MRSKWSEYICNSPRGGGFTNSIPKERDSKMLGFNMNAKYYNFISNPFPPIHQRTHRIYFKNYSSNHE